jgi:predicted HicB family RNase H-like nuclease
MRLTMAKKPKADARSKQLNARVPAALLQWVEKQAEEREMSLSDVVNEALNEKQRNEETPIDCRVR